MYLSELLIMRKFDPNNEIKIVRHQDSRLGSMNSPITLSEVYQNGDIEIYQRYQSKKVFSSCKYLLVFIGDGGMRSKFIGAFEVLSMRKVKDVPDRLIFPYDETVLLIDENDYYYDLKKLDLLDDLIDRLIIKWDGQPNSWYRYFSQKNDKEVIEILAGTGKMFPGYDEVILSFNELKEIIEKPDSHKNWYTALKEVYGIYLIVTGDGKHYVGSAYGKEGGILGRWTDYARPLHHGGNKKIIELIKDQPNAYKSFQFSILEILPKTLDRTKVLEKENLYKKKLRTREFGLNYN